MSSRRSDPTSEDLAALLSELQTTLNRLQSELDANGVDDGRGGRRTRDAPRPPSRPPTLGELLRFTDEYTIPTVIAVLETSIQSLELLRGVLRLTDPSRSLGSDAPESARRLTSEAGRRATSRVESALSDLQTALSEADLPEDERARTLVDDARSLSAEIDRALADARTDAGRERRRRTGRRGGVSIRVDEEATDTATEEATEEAAEENEAESTRIDVEAELASLKEDVESGADDADEEPQED